MALRFHICAIALLHLAALGVGAEDFPAEDLAFFEDHVRPVLVEHCQGCHGANKQESSLRLDSRAALMQGGDTGPAIEPDQPDESLLLRMLRGADGIVMPPEDPLDPQQVESIAEWVRRGAPWPDEQTAIAVRGGPITDEDRAFWSFQPVKDPAPPQVDNDAWSTSDIDRYLLANMQSAGLAPARPADRRAWIRRATFDLTGLPPTPEEVAAFVNDASPNAYGAVIDRLLASPAYGERWGRHWLDVVRYADTAGETADYPVREAYLYRNYVIDAFNADKPYDQFLREQIAGDLLAADLANEHAGNWDDASLARYRELVTATGFIAISRRFGFDPQNYHHLTIQDTIDTLGQATLGLTLGCARCHDHKYDPVNIEDYYALHGIFESTRYAFPGSEEKKRPADFVPAVPPEIAATLAEGTCEVLYGVMDGEPRNALIQLRGEPLRPGAEVPRRWLEVLGGEPLPPDAGSGRRQLADWIASPTNPLTARVMVNRIWQQHFGRGLVSTPNDFGTRGAAPSHPELLDWLAARFIESGWSVKTMHRLIMNSSAYRLSAQADVAASEADPDNALLSHFSRRRLSAEELRDAMLFVSGRLDPSIGQAHPFPDVNSWEFTQHVPFYAVYDTNQRSIYLMQQRLKRHPVLALFDGADPNTTTPVRTTTTVPTQALFLMNSEFIHGCSSGLADQLMNQSGNETSGIGSAYEITLGRSATSVELDQAAEFLTAFRLVAFEEGVPEADVERAAWSALARVLLSSNEFLYVE